MLRRSADGGRRKKEVSQNSKISKTGLSPIRRTPVLGPQARRRTSQLTELCAPSNAGCSLLCSSTSLCLSSYLLFDFIEHSEKRLWHNNLRSPIHNFVSNNHFTTLSERIPINTILKLDSLVEILHISRLQLPACQQTFCSALSFVSCASVACVNTPMHGCNQRCLRSQSTSHVSADN